MPIFEYEGKKYRVSNEKLNKFTEEFPDAVTYEERGGKKYRVSAKKYNKFLQEFDGVNPDGTTGERRVQNEAAMGREEKAATGTPTGGEEKATMGRLNVDAETYLAGRKSLQQRVEDARREAEAAKNAANSYAAPWQVSKAEAPEQIARPKQMTPWDVERAAFESDEEKRIDFRPRVAQTARDVYDNYMERFGLTEEGKRLNEEYNRAMGEIGSNLWNEWADTDEYRTIVAAYNEKAKGVKSKEELEGLNQRMNDELSKRFELEYGDRYRQEAEPYDRALHGAMQNRYGKQIQAENMKLDKAAQGGIVSDMTANVDRMLTDAQGRRENRFVGPQMAALRGKSALTDDERDLYAAKQQLTEAQQLLDKANGANGWKAFAGKTDWSLFTQGAQESEESIRLGNVLQKSEKGERLTEAEQSLLDAALTNMTVQAYYSDESNWLYDMGAVTAESIPFMLEMIVSPVNSLGNALSKRLLKYGLKKFASSASRKGVERTMRVASNIVGRALVAPAAMTATTSAGHVAAGTQERMNQNYDIRQGEDMSAYAVRNNEGIGVGEALAKSAASTFFENQSEMVFRAFEGAGKFLGRYAEKLVPGKAAEMLSRMKQSKVGKLWTDVHNNPYMKGLRNQANIGGIGEEYLEEVYNNFANVGLGEMSIEDATSLETNVSTFLGLVPTQVFFSALGVGGYVAGRRRNNKEVARYRAMLTEDVQREVEDVVIAARTSDDALTDYYMSIIGNDSLTPEQKKARMQYAKALQERDTLDGIEEAKQSETPTRQEAAMEAGAQAETPEEKHGISRRYEEAVAWREKLTDEDGQLGAILDMEDREVAVVELEKQGYSDRMQEAFDYWDAMDAYEGMAIGANNRVDEAVADANWQAARRAHVDGRIIEATTADRGIVHVKGGNIVWNDDGTVNVALSDPQIFVVNEEGRIEMMSPRHIMQAAERGTLQAQREYNNATLREQLEKQEADEVELNPNTPQVMIGTTYADNGRQMVVVGVNEDNAMVVPVDEKGATPQTVPVDALRAMISNELDGAEVDEKADGLDGLDGSDGLEGQQDGQELQEQPGARERVPKDEQGNLLYEEADADTAWDAIVEEAEGDEAIAQEAVGDIVGEAEKELKAAEKALKKAEEAKPETKGAAPTMAERLAAKKQARVNIEAAQAEVDKAKARLKKWQEIAGTVGRRNAAIEAEAKAVREAEEAARRNAEEAERLMAEEPQNGRERAAQAIGTGEVMLLIDSYKRETGYGDKEVKGMFGTFAGKEKGGKTIEEAAEYLVAQDEQGFFGGDVQEARNAILDVLQGVRKKSELRNYIANQRKAAADEMARAEREAYEAWTMGSYGMTPEEYENYVQMLEESRPSDVAVEEIRAIFAEVYLEEENRLNNNDNGQERVSESIEGSNEVLLGEQTDFEGGDAAISEGGQGNEDGLGIDSADAASQEEAGEIKPVELGENSWGKVFQWVKGKVVDAAKFLKKSQNGYLRGVFYREELGDIDLFWGNEKGGLAHIIDKHIIKHSDFASVEDAVSVIDDVISTGEIIEQPNGRIAFLKDGYRVVTERTFEGNWVVTAFDETVKQKDKKRSEEDATRLHQDIFGKENGELVSPNSASEGKGSESLGNEQGIEGKMFPMTESEFIDARQKELMAENPELDDVDAYNQASDEYPSYIEELIKSGYLEELYADSSIADRVKLGQIVQVAGFETSDISGEANRREKEQEKAKREQESAKYKKGKFVEIRYLDGSIVVGQIVNNADGNVTVRRNDGRVYTVPVSRILDGSTKMREVAPSDVMGRVENIANDYWREREEKRRKPLRERVKQWEQALGVKVTVIERLDDVRDRAARRAIERGRTVLGWYDTATGEVCVYLPLNSSVKEVDKTVLHELVGHDGLRGLLGKEGFDALCDKVWAMMPQSARRRYTNYQSVRDIADNVERNRAAADEYMANMAEREKLLPQQKNIWDKIVEFVRGLFGERLGKDEILSKDNLGKKDIAELLKLSYQRMAEKADGQNGSNGENGTRFREVKDKNELIAVHNISEDNLRKTLNAGGLIMPSIAITRADMGHEGFGEISLLFDKETINPSDRRNKVYGGDAWTPRFPTISGKLNDKVVSKINKKIYGLIEDRKVRDNYSLSSEVYPDNIERTISNYGVEGYYGKEWMKLAYLLDSGKKVRVPMKMTDYGEMSETIIEMAKERGLKVSNIQNEGIDFYTNNPDFVEALHEAKINKRLEGIAEEQKESVRELLREKKMSFAGFDSLVGRAVTMEYDLEHGGLKQIIDKAALRDAIEKKVKTNNADYNRWVNELFDGIIEKYGIRNNRDPYTSSGSSRPWEQLYDPATPANILKHMLAENEQGGSGGFFDSNIMGASAETYESIEEIREKGKRRLKKVDDETYDEWSSSIVDRMSAICADFMPPEQRNSFGASIDAKIDITNAVAEDKTAKGIYKGMRREYPRFTMEHAKQVEAIVKEIQDSAIGYFEAKPRRIVPLSEVKKAIVPSNVSSDILEGLKEKGIEVATYRKGNEVARKRLIKKESDGLRFRELEAVNESYNKRLIELDSNPNQKDKVLRLGRPSDFLKDGGVIDAEIEMEFDKFVRKSSETYKNNHPFTANDIKDLPKAIYSPIAVFDSTNLRDKVILTELNKDGNNFIVAIKAVQRKRKGGVILEVNDIATLYPKEAKGIVNWINNGLIANVDKEKALHWLEALRTHHGTELINEELVSAAKVVEEFENPKLSGGNVTMFREGEGEMTDKDVVMQSDMYSAFLGKPRYSGKRMRDYVARQRGKMVDRVKDMAKKMGVEVTIINSVTDAPKEVKRILRKHPKSKGWYDVATGKVVIIMPNHGSVEDVTSTVLHECVAHYGLRKLFGKRFDKFLDNVYMNADPDVFKRISELAQKNGWDYRVATEEYLASLAEDTNFENARNSGWFQRIKDFFIDMMHALGLDDVVGASLSDNELRYILWRSYENMVRPGSYLNKFVEAGDMSMQKRLKVGDYQKLLDIQKLGNVDLSGYVPMVAEDSSYSDNSGYRGGDLRFRVEEGEMEAEIAKYLKEYKSAPFSVFYTRDEALQELMGLTKDRKLINEILGLMNDKDSWGVYAEDLNRIFIFAENIPDARNVKFAMKHENAHASMSELFPEGKRDAEFDVLYEGFKNDVASRYVSEVNNKYKDYSERKRREELIALGIEVVDEQRILDSLKGEAKDLYNEILTDNKKEYGSTNRRRMESTPEDAGRRPDRRRTGDIQKLSRPTEESGGLYPEAEQGRASHVGRRVGSLSERVLEEIVRLEEELNTSVEAIDSFDALPEGKAKDAIAEGRKVLGWYQDGRVYVYMPNARSASDVRATVCHEVIGHMGLRKMLGGRFNAFLDRVYMNLPADVRAELNRRATRKHWDFREATEEYMAELAERFARGEGISSLRKLLYVVRDAVVKALNHLGIDLGFEMSDKYLMYVLWASKHNLRPSDVTGRIADVAMRYLLNVDGDVVRAASYHGMNGADGLNGSDGRVAFREVTDKETLDFLNGQDTMKAYRAMQVIDGKLYPPMSAKVEGKLREPIELGKWEEAEERPDLADEKGYFKLDKANKSSLKARYNPYIHTSLTPLNDQFSSAQERPNLVTVEVEIPVSELTSGYKADKAKDAVGKVEWKAGVVQSQLTGTRTVILSRWDKPVRIVPESEVAERIVEMFGDKKVVMPSNVVTPQLREELEKRGVPFVETDNQGKRIKADGLRFREIDEVNERFNEQLEGLTEQNAREKILDLGVPSDILLSCGIENKHIRLYGAKLLSKIKKHGYLLSDIKDLPNSLISPIAVFRGSQNGSYAILTELHIDGNNVLVSLSVGKGGHDVDFNVISSIYGKNNDGVIRWINDGKLLYVNKRKALNYLSVPAPIAGAQDNQELDQQRTNLADVEYLGLPSEEERQDANPKLDSVAKVIRNFENPKVEGGNNSSYSDNSVYRGGETRFREVEPEDDATRMTREAYEKNLKTLSYRLREGFQDSMLALKELQDAIVKTLGHDLEEHENAYVEENHLSSKNKAGFGHLSRHLYRPLLEVVHSMMQKGNMSYQDVLNYLNAKHGIERNRDWAVRDALNAMRKEAEDDAQRQVVDDMEQSYYDYRDAMYEELENGYIDFDQYCDLMDAKARDYVPGYDGKEDYSGLSSVFGEEGDVDAEWYDRARGYVRNVESKLEDETDALWEAVGAVNQYTLDKAKSSGTMSVDDHKKISNQFKWYVPLRGFQEETAEEAYEYFMRDSTTGAYSPTVKEGRGRKSQADDIIATMMNMAQSTIMHGNKNLMKQKFLNLVVNSKTGLVTVLDNWYENRGTLDNPVWEPVYPDFKPDATADEIAQAIDVFNADMEAKEKQGLAKKAKGGERIPYRVTKKSQLDEHIVIAKRNGQEFRMVLNGNPRAAQALNGLTNPDVADGVLEKLAQKVNPYLASVFTTKNPTFVARNLIRDSIMSGSSVMIKESFWYGNRFRGNQLRALRHIAGLLKKYNAGTLDMNNPMERYFKEFVENGAETGYSQLWNVDKFKSDIEKELNRMNGGVKNGAIKAGTAIFDGLEFMNRCAEDLNRFAVYMTSRESGRSIQRSVHDAKEVTVNFNKKGAGARAGGWVGTAAQFARTFYLFFNAAVQGLTNYTRMAKNHPAKFAGIVSLFAAWGGAMPILNAFMEAVFGDDDDKDTYNDLPEWVRRNNACLFVPFAGEKGTVITVPLPIELRAIYGLGEAVTQIILGNETKREALASVVSQFMEMAPINPLSGGVENFDALSLIQAVTPTALQPIVQHIQNKDWTGRPIYKDDKRLERYPEYTKVYANTPQFLVQGSKLLNDATRGNKAARGWAQVNPAIVEHYLSGYTGGVGTTIMDIVKCYDMFFGDEPFDVRNIPVVKAVVQTPTERNKYSTTNKKYYELLDEYEEFKHRERNYKRISEEGGSDAAEYMRLYEELHDSATVRRMEGFKELNKELKALDELKGDVAESSLNKMKNELRKRAVELYGLD